MKEAIEGPKSRISRIMNLGVEAKPRILEWEDI
jgi:hypothetical protein